MTPPGPAADGGLPAGLAGLDTPALVVDLDVVAANIAEMAAVARSAGVALRPHAKTHKMPALALAQLAAGAVGLTCAKLGEAEVFADAGCTDLLVAYPLWGESKLARLRALRERVRVRVSLDSLEVAAAVGSVATPAAGPVEVLAEVDTGLGRLGRPPGEPTVALLRELTAVPGIRVVGLLTHAGHGYAAADAAERDRVAFAEADDVVRTAQRATAAGIELTEVSVGSTPTARVAARVPGVTEIRPGTYVFNDTTMIRLGVATEESCAARVLTTVVARPAADRFVVDAGTKCLAADGAGRPDWVRPAGRPELAMRFLSEEHGVGRVLAGPGPRIGERLALIPSHVCATVNLWDSAVGVRGGVVTERLAVAARGRVN